MLTTVCETCNLNKELQYLIRFEPQINALGLNNTYANQLDLIAENSLQCSNSFIEVKWHGSMSTYYFQTIHVTTLTDYRNYDIIRLFDYI